MSLADTWKQFSDGLGTAWKHRDGDLTVKIEVWQSPHPTRDEKQYQVLVKDHESVVWPADWPDNGGTGLYQCWSQATSAAEHVRRHLSLGKPVDEISMSGGSSQ